MITKCLSCDKELKNDRHSLCSWCRRKTKCPNCDNWKWDVSATCKKCMPKGNKHPRWRGGKEVWAKNLCACGSKKSRTSKQCKSCYKPHWKGGKAQNKGGYTLIRIPEHPRSHNGYVLEHIVVMEKMIGRPLLFHENVHHKNGVKNDNRPQNLELWSRSHPPGQRVQDKLAWAKEIIETYAEYPSWI